MTHSRSLSPPLSVNAYCRRLNPHNPNAPDAKPHPNARHNDANPHPNPKLNPKPNPNPNPNPNILTLK